MSAETITEFAGYELESPLVNAAGLINGTNPDTLIREVGELAETGVGAITVGSFTMLERAGNEATLLAAGVMNPKVEHWDEDTGRMVNSMGLPNVGIAKADMMVRAIKRAAGDKPVIFSVSPTADVDMSSPEQAVSMAGALYFQEASIVEVNVSCPNVVTEDGGRKPIMGYDVAAMHDLIWRTNGTQLDYDGRFKLGIKLPPYMSDEQIEVAFEVAVMLRESKAFDFVTTSNTIPGVVPKHPDGSNILSVEGGGGGLSGPATRDEGQAQLVMWDKLLSGSGMDIISTQGVFDGGELTERLDLGATLGGAVTRFWVGGDRRQTATDVLVEYADTSL